MKRLLAIAGLFSLVFTLAYHQPVEAQTGVDQSVTISSQPRYPEPGEAVTLSLDAYALGYTGGTYAWYVDGKLQESATNARTLTLTAGTIGTNQTITAQVLKGGVVIAQANYELKPSDINIIIEADTTVPAFYIGRPLPSVGSTIRAIAIPTTSNQAPPGKYVYTWRLNNKVINGGPQNGRYIQAMELPLGREHIVQVDVADQTGEILGSEQVVVSTITPELQFYADNPLRGQAKVATDNELALLGEEVDIKAEPYYMSKTIYNSNPLLEWSIDGQTVANPNSNPQILTLQKSGGTGTFKIGFHIRNLARLSQGVEDSFLIKF